MRALLFTIGLALSSPASAQDNAVHIPYSPTTPAAFNIDVQTLLAYEGEPVLRQRFNYGVEIRGAEPSYEAALTVLSADSDGDFVGFDPADLIGFPGVIVVVLGAAGEPTSISDWARVRGELEDRDISLGPVAEHQPLVAAATLAWPLAVLAFCQNFNLRVGVPETKHAPPSSRSGIVTALHASREIQSVDREAGMAQVVFINRVESQGENSAPGDAPLESTTMRVACSVDLRSGMAETATVELTTSGSIGGVSTTRMEITVTPLSRQD